jgi:Fe-S cluster assembly protein SufD
VTAEREFYRAAFDDRFGAAGPGEPAWLRARRRRALERFADAGYPGLRHEAWRHTSLAALSKAPLRTERADPARADLAAARRLLGEDRGSIRLAFVDGAYRPELSSSPPAGKGAYVAPLSLARRDRPELVERFLAQPADAEGAFAALNSAFAEEGVVIALEPGARAERPVELVWIATAASEGAVHHPRVEIEAGARSQVTVLERYEGEGTYFTNARTNVSLADGAAVEHLKLQDESAGAFHLAGTSVRQAGASRFVSHLFQLGGSLARNELGVSLAATGAECVLNGLYAGRDRQHLDSRSRIDHASPGCRSQELYKGVLSGEARAVFNGTIDVREGAQGTDADQTNRNLLLSRDAAVNAQPQLRILADDVRCTHGATVSQLDDDSLFYLRSRGIGPAEARRMVTRAFMAELVGRLPEAWREGLDARLARWLDGEERE